MSEQTSRYLIGIDLGTTNSAVCYVDTAAGDGADVVTLPIPQLIAAGETEDRETLPSFHYEPAAGEFAAADLQLPWKDDSSYLVGAFARDHGIHVPGRMVAARHLRCATDCCRVRSSRRLLESPDGGLGLGSPRAERGAPSIHQQRVSP